MALVQLKLAHDMTRKTVVVTYDERLTPGKRVTLVDDNREWMILSTSDRIERRVYKSLISGPEPACDLNEDGGMHGMDTPLGSISFG